MNGRANERTNERIADGARSWLRGGAALQERGADAAQVRVEGARARVVIDRLLSSSLSSCSPGAGRLRWGRCGVRRCGWGAVRSGLGRGVELVGVQCAERDVDDPAGEIGEDRGHGGDGLDHPGPGLTAPQAGGARHGEVSLDPDGVHHLQGRCYRRRPRSGWRHRRHQRYPGPTTSPARSPAAHQASPGAVSTAAQR